MLCRVFSQVLLGVSLVASAAALEVVGDADPSYLALEMRPTWRMAEQARVLNEINQLIELPVARSAAVEAAGKQAVIYIAEERLSVRRVLEWLESTHDLRFIAEPLRLRVETAADARDRRRRVVDLDLREFAVWETLPDFHTPHLGLLREGSTGGGGFDMFGGEGVEENVDPSELLELWSNNAELTIRGERAWLSLTPEEEAALRGSLDRQFVQATVRSQWRLSAGMLPPGQALRMGVMEAAQAKEIRATLRQVRVLELAGFQGQRVSAQHGDDEVRVLDVERESDLYKPVTDVLEHGLSLAITTLRGANYAHLKLHAQWVEPLTAVAGRFAYPALGAEAAADNGGPISGQIAMEEDGKKGALTLKYGEGTRPAVPSLNLPLDQMSWWAWRPRLDLVIPVGHALVLAAEHPQGRAVLVLEEVQP